MSDGLGHDRTADVRRRAAKSMFSLLASLPADDPRRVALRNRLVEMHLPLVRYFVHRYADRGEPADDLFQTGAVGLVKAVDRFDPDRGVEFVTFASPTILGEIRRHFRDYTWTVHVDRGLQELALATGRCRAELTQELGRLPTVPELADRTGQPRDRVADAVACMSSRSVGSLQALTRTDTPVSDRLGAEDSAFERVDLHESLLPLLARLPDRERLILQLRFCGNQTQSQIAERIGVSQMQVSRLLARTLLDLRTELLAEGRQRGRDRTRDVAVGGRPVCGERRRRASVGGRRRSGPVPASSRLGGRTPSC
jgi:RNA polymerase sigma-B factor